MVVEYIVQSRIVGTRVMYDVISRDGEGDNITVLTYTNNAIAQHIMNELNSAIDYHPISSEVENRQITNHQNLHGTWCRWSGIMVGPGYTSKRCPNECAASDIMTL